MANPCYGIGHCVGRFVNPITDMCWKCLFPITIAGFSVASSSMPDTPTSSNLICLCPRAGMPFPVPGIPVGFWEPVRLVDVTKKPMCLISLGGISCGDNTRKGMQDNDTGTSFYHVHWYIYPVIYWLELLADFICLEEAAVDVAYLTEFDPLWGDDAKSAIINPETLLFQNVAAYQACIADCMSCSADALANDMLLWCAGCQGMLYPLTGTTAAHNGGVGTSLLWIISEHLKAL